MTPGTIFWTALAIYLSVGMLLSLRDVTAVATADTEALCSDACRDWHSQALGPARAMYEMPIIAPFVLAVSATVWPWALKNRCGCFRKAARTDFT